MITNSVNIQNVLENWEISPGQNVKTNVTGCEKEATAVVLFIHGGPNLNYKDAIESQGPFFTDLAEKKLLIIAPHYPYSDLNNPNHDYRDLIDNTAQKIVEKYPSLPLNVICHSYGAHLTGRTLLRDNALSQNIKKLVVMSGTTHHGAGALRRDLSDIVSLVKQLPIDEQNNIIYEESPLAYNSKNKGIIATQQKITGLLNQLVFTDQERLPLDKFKEVDCLNNTLISKDINKNYSIQYHLPKLERRFPILILHPIKDCAVTVDVGLAFFKTLQKNGWEVQFTTEENSPHNWMKKGTPHSEDLSFQQLFGSLIHFLEEGSLEREEVENALAVAEDYLERNPDLNYMDLYRRFHQNQEITFTSFDNFGLKLTKDEINGPRLTQKKSQGIEATKEALNVYVDPYKKSQEEIQLMIEETENLLGKMDKDPRSDIYRYYAFQVLPKLKSLKK